MKFLLMRVLGTPAGLLAAHALRLSGAPVGVAIMYHRVGDPQGDPDVEVVPKLGTRLFARQMRILKAAYRVVPASDLPGAAVTRRRGRRIPAAITFDDDLTSHVTHAAPELRRRGLTATFFLCGASLSRPFVFWWDHLQAAVDRGLVDVPSLVPANPPAETIHDVAEAVKVLPQAERDALASRLAEILGSDHDGAGMPARQVRSLVEAGFEVGFHTRRHDFLPSLDDDALSAAMREGRAELEELAGRPLVSFAYPHGGFDARVVAAVRDAGFRYAFTTQLEALGATTDPLAIGRPEAPFESSGRFALRLARALWRARKARMDGGTNR